MPVRLEKDADWVIKIMGDEYFITDEEYQIIRRASLTDKRLVWFNDLTINISHIVTINRVKKSRPSLADVGDELPKMSPEQVERNKSRIRDLKNGLIEIIESKSK